MLRPYLALALGALSLSADFSRAADYSGPAKPLTTAVQKEPVDTLVPIYRAFVNAGPDKFTFLLPEGFRLGGDPGHGRLQLVNAKIDCCINFNLLSVARAGSQESMN